MYIENGKPAGPVSESELYALIEQGELNPHDLVAQKGDRSWIAIKEHPKLNKVSESKSKPKADSIDKHWVILVKKPPHRGGGYTQKGPYDQQELIAMVKAGDAAFTDYAWRPGYKKWVKITETEMFSSKVSSSEASDDLDLPDIPESEGQDLLENVVVQNKKSDQSVEYDEKDLVQNYESQKQFGDVPPVPNLSDDEDRVSDHVDSVENDISTDKEEGLSPEDSELPSDEDDFEPQAPIINTTTKEFKEFEETSVKKVKSSSSKKRSKSKRKKKKKQNFFKTLFKAKKKKQSSKPAIDDFKSWRDEEAFLKAARREQIKKRVLQISLLGGFGVALFAVSFFLILKFMGPKSASQPPEQKVVHNQVKATTNDKKVEPKVSQTQNRFASYLKVGLGNSALVFNFDQFRNPTMNIQLIANPKKSLLSKGFYYQSMVQVSGQSYRFPIQSLVAGEYILKAQLDEQHVEERFSVKSEQISELKLEWAKKRKSYLANKEKFLAVENSRKLMKLAEQLNNPPSESWNRFYSKWRLALSKAMPSFINSNLSKITGPNDLVYINFWLQYQSKHQKLEQLGQLLNSNRSKSIQSLDIQSYSSLYESSRQLSLW